MKFKKVLASVLVAATTMSLMACGGGTKETTKSTETNGNGETTTSGSTNGSTSTGGEKLVVWTLAEDLKQFADYYMEQNENVDIEVVVIAPADYVTKLTSALRGKSEIPDIIVGEPQMLPDFFEAGFFEDLSQAPYNAEDYRDQIVDYIYEAGKDEDGVIRALSYQITPGGIFYRRDIAQEVWGNDDPEFISDKYKDFDSIIETAEELKAAGYRIFSDTGNLRWYASKDPWVIDGKLNMSENRLAYMDTAVELYQNQLVAFAPEWSSAWYVSMADQIPLNAEWQDVAEIEEGGDLTEVFSYTLPSWGSLVIRDNAGDNAGKFGVASGVNSFFGGGTFIGISTYSNNKEVAWDFVKFTTIDEDTARWWADVSKGDVVSNRAVLEELKDKENETYGNQKTYAFYLEEAEKIDYSLVTKYDDPLKEQYGQAVEFVQRGEKSKEEALKEFYANVQSIYPEIEVPSE